VAETTHMPRGTSVIGQKKDNRLRVAAQWEEHETLALVDSGAQMDIIDWSYANRCQMPGRRKKRDTLPAKGPFRTCEGLGN